MSPRVIIGICLLVYVMAKLRGISAPGTPKEKVEMFTALRDIVFYGSFFAMGLGLLFYRPTGNHIHPGWWFLLCINIAILLTVCTLKIMGAERLYGYGPTKNDIADMRREYERDEFFREVRAHELVDVPRMAANPFDPTFEYSMTPEQMCDPDVVAEWRRLGKPIAKKSWAARYNRKRP